MGRPLLPHRNCRPKYRAQGRHLPYEGTPPESRTNDSAAKCETRQFVPGRSDTSLPCLSGILQPWLAAPKTIAPMASVADSARPRLLAKMRVGLDHARAP